MNKDIKFLNAGKFISRGHGRHPVRIIDSYELIYVIAGTLSIFEEKTAYTLEAGEYLLLYPEKMHGGTLNYPHNLSFFWGHFHAPCNFRDKFPKYGMTARPDRFADYYQLLLSEQNNHSSGMTCNLLMEILLNETLLSTEDNSVKYRHLTEMAMRILKTRFSEDISTASISGELSCNADYLGRIFKEIYGITIICQLNIFRTANAAKLLKSTARTVKEIGFESGFNDLAYFRRQFFRIYSVTPAQYRKIHSEGHINTE